MFLMGKSSKIDLDVHRCIESWWGGKSVLWQFIVTDQIEISSLRAGASVNLLSFGEGRDFKKRV